MKAVLRAVWDGMRLTCPSCRRGPMFRSRSHLHVRCPACGVVFERDAGEFVGAVMVAYSVTGVMIIVGVFALEMLADPPAEVHLAVWGAAGVIIPILFYRHMKGIWVGILHAMVGLTRD